MATPGSMFGMSPLDVVQQRIQEQEKMNMLRRTQRAQEGSEFGVFAPLYRAGLGFGDIAGQALTQGVFGQQQDPMLKKAVDIQSVLSGKDVTKAEDLSTIADTLSKMGYSNEAMAAAQQARAIKIQDAELGIKQAKAGREVREAAQKNVKFYKENPDQAEFRIAELAQTLSTDPTNAAALKEYTEITRAASEGAIEAAGKQEKAAVDLAKDRAQLAKYRKDLADAEKFGPAQRWDAETDAARKLLQTYNIDITKPLEGQVKGSTAYGPMAGEISQAFERAVRKKTTEGGGPSSAPAATPTAAPATAGGSSNVEASVRASGLAYEPDKYEYRVLANGTVQRKKK